MKDIELVIFDCDGVLVDSELISAQVIAEVLRPLGIEMTTEESYKQFVGGNMQNIIDYAVTTLGYTPDVDIQAEYRRKSFDAYRQQMKPVEGVEEILQNLKVDKCVGSNGPKNKIHLNLEITGLDQYFQKDKIFSAYDIEVWKPAPDLYLHAAKSYNIDPERCLVIEDSINGLKAAHSAGMTSFGINYPMKPLPSDIPGSEIFGDMTAIKNKMIEFNLI